MRHGVASVVLAIVASTNLPAQAPPGSKMFLARSSRGLPVVVVQAGDQTLRLGLDTGTSRTLISSSAAERLRLQPVSRFVLAGPAGVPHAGVCGRASSLRVADTPVHVECIGWIPDEPEIAGAEGLDGLLGADALAQVDLWLDLRSERPVARFAPPNSLANWTEGIRIPLELVGRRPAVTMQIGLGHLTLPARLILDSGSDGLVLFGNLAGHAAVAMRHQQMPARIETATATQTISLIPVSSLRSGRLAVSPGWAGLLPDRIDRSEDGLLPLQTLGPVMLSLSGGFVIAGAELRARSRASDGFRRIRRLN